MRESRTRQILKAASKLPPARARVLVQAVAAKSQPKKPSREDLLSDAARLFEAAMIDAALTALEQEAI